jgi:hypothetical protein
LLLIVDLFAQGYQKLQANTHYSDYSHWAITNPLMMVWNFWQSRTFNPSHVISSHVQGKSNKALSSFPNAT